MLLFQAEQASKRIERTRILDQINIRINRHENIGIVGKNGSGKSSLLKLIGAIYEPSSGKVIRNTKNIGYVPEHFPENIRFTVYEYLCLVGRMSGADKRDVQARITRYGEWFHLTPFLQTPISKCSKGTKQKVGMLQALLKEPDLLLLDEPLTGLDDASQEELAAQLASLQNEVAIVFTAHEPNFVQQLAHRVVEIERGKIVSDLPVYQEESNMRIKLRIPNDDATHAYEQLPGYEFNGKDIVAFSVKPDECDRILLQALQAGCSIIEVK